MAPGRESAVIFAELIGAAELYTHAGDAAAHEAISRCVDKLSQTAAASSARVVKRIGGRLMMLAESAHAAAREFSEAAAGNLGLGIGFHYGPVIEENADVFGDTVNVAARLVEQAARGQILLDADTAEGVDGLYRQTIRRLYTVQLKGLNEELSLCEMVWRADDAATFFPFDAASAPGRAKLKLKYRGNKLVLRKILEALTIGRDQRCGLVVEDELASRHHCSIQRRHDHFVLADKSTNGTFVTVEGEGEVMLQRDELTLRKRGWISFGRPHGAGKEAVEFFCD